MTDSKQTSSNTANDYAIARAEWEALVERFRRGEHVDAAEFELKLDALNRAYARHAGLVPPDASPGQ